MQIEAKQIESAERAAKAAAMEEAGARSQLEQAIRRAGFAAGYAQALRDAAALNRPPASGAPTSGETAP